MQFQVSKKCLDLDAWMHKKASLAAAFFLFFLFYVYMQPVGYDRPFGGGLAVLSYIQDITQGIIKYRHSFSSHLSHLSVHTIFTLKFLTTSWYCSRTE